MLIYNRTGFLFALSLKSLLRLSRLQFTDSHSGVLHPSVSCASLWTFVTRPATNYGLSSYASNRLPRPMIPRPLTWRPTPTLPTTSLTVPQSTLPRQMPKKVEPLSCFNHHHADITPLFLTRRIIHHLLAQQTIGFPRHHGP